MGSRERIIEEDQWEAVESKKVQANLHLPVADALLYLSFAGIFPRITCQNIKQPTQDVKVRGNGHSQSGELGFQS